MLMIASDFHGGKYRSGTSLCFNKDIHFENIECKYGTLSENQQVYEDGVHWAKKVIFGYNVWGMDERELCYYLVFRWISGL